MCKILLCIILLHQESRKRDGFHEDQSPDKIIKEFPTMLLALQVAGSDFILLISVMLRTKTCLIFFL